MYKYVQQKNVYGSVTDMHIIVYKIYYNSVYSSVTMVHTIAAITANARTMCKINMAKQQIMQHITKNIRLQAWKHVALYHPRNN
jgi:hypothetical protein